MQEITKRACKVTVHGQAKQQKSKHRERKKYVRNNTHTRLNAVQITAAKCLREKDFHLVTKKKNKPKTKLKDEGIGKEKSQPRDATAFEMPWTRNKPNRTEPSRIRIRTRTKLDLAWQQVADAAADDDHEDQRRVS